MQLDRSGLQQAEPFHILAERIRVADVGVRRSGLCLQAGAEQVRLVAEILLVAGMRRSERRVSVRPDVPRRIALTHYFNLGATERRLKKLLRDFKMAPMKEVLNIEAAGLAQ